MKNNKLIIYDDNCPMCAVYTKAFVATGMIEKNNRKNFSTIDPEILHKLDIEKCRNEIPVIDPETAEIWYGIDAIVEILRSKMPWVKKTAGVPPIRWILNRTYKLISYNRRVIVAAETQPGNFDCTPDFNYKYRALFLLLCLLFNSVMLLPFHQNIFHASFINASFLQIQGAHALLVFLNVTTALSLERRLAFEYLGQVNMLALTVVLLMIPLMALNNFLPAKNSVFNNLYLILLLLVVYKEYKRRMNFAGIFKQQPGIVAANVIGVTAFICYLAW